MCSVSSLYGDQAISGLLKSCKDCGKVLWEIQFEFKIQIDMDHSNMLHSRRVVKPPCQMPNSYLIRPPALVLFEFYVCIKLNPSRERGEEGVKSSHSYYFMVVRVHHVVLPV